MLRVQQQQYPACSSRAHQQGSMLQVWRYPLPPTLTCLPMGPFSRVWQACRTLSSRSPGCSSSSSSRLAMVLLLVQSVLAAC
jgi:hypothetical protein